MDGIVDFVRPILEMGWPAIVLIQAWLIWREYKAINREYIDTLKDIAETKHNLAKVEQIVKEALAMKEANAAARPVTAGPPGD